MFSPFMDQGLNAKNIVGMNANASGFSFDDSEGSCFTYNHVSLSKPEGVTLRRSSSNTNVSNGSASRRPISESFLDELLVSKGSGAFDFGEVGGGGAGAPSFSSGGNAASSGFASTMSGAGDTGFLNFLGGAGAAGNSGSGSGGVASGNGTTSASATGGAGFCISSPPGLGLGGGSKGSGGGGLLKSSSTACLNPLSRPHSFHFNSGGLADSGVAGLSSSATTSSSSLNCSFTDDLEFYDKLVKDFTFSLEDTKTSGAGCSSAIDSSKFRLGSGSNGSGGTSTSTSPTSHTAGKPSSASNGNPSSMNSDGGYGSAGPQSLFNEQLEVLVDWFQNSCSATERMTVVYNLLHLANDPVQLKFFGNICSTLINNNVNQNFNAAFGPSSLGTAGSGGLCSGTTSYGTYKAGNGGQAGSSSVYLTRSVKNHMRSIKRPVSEVIGYSRFQSTTGGFGSSNAGYSGNGAGSGLPSGANGSNLAAYSVSRPSSSNSTTSNASSTGSNRNYSPVSGFSSCDPLNKEKGKIPETIQINDLNGKKRIRRAT